MKIRILVVDDEPDICQILSEILRAEGYDVVVAHNSDEFCLQALTKIPNLIILDINLGNSLGPEVYSEILCKGLDPTTPVIFLSALVPEEFVSKDIVPSGRKYTLHAKPFHHDRLIQDVRRLTENLNTEAA